MPSPEAVFLILAGFFGVILVFANPPFQAPDECDHYARILQLSDGTLIGERRGNTAGGEIASAAVNATNTEGIPFHPELKMTLPLYRRIATPLTLDWRTAPREYRVFPHTVVYAPSGYFPQTAAVAVGRFLHAGPLLILYLARLASLVAAIAACRFALGRLPCYKWTVTVALLGPMSLYILGSPAPDGFIISACLLLLALGARAEAGAGRAQTSGAGPGSAATEAAVFIGVACLIGTAKFVYLPLAAAAAWMLLPRFPSRRARIGFCVALAAASLIPTALWSRVIASLFVPSNGDLPIDPSAQIRYVLSAPAAFIALVGRTINYDWLEEYRWLAGMLGWGDTPMPGWWYPFFGVTLAACAASESAGPGVIRPSRRVALAAAAVATFLLVYLAQYSTWNPPRSSDPIDGIEGRYFLPLLPFIALSLPRLPGRLSRLVGPSLAPALACATAATGCLVCLWSLITRYYVR